MSKFAFSFVTKLHGADADGYVTQSPLKHNSSNSNVCDRNWLYTKELGSEV